MGKKRATFFTFASIAAAPGVNPFDELAAQSNLPPVDGLNMWPLLSGANSTSPRVEIPVDGQTLIQVGWRWTWAECE